MGGAHAWGALSMRSRADRAAVVMKLRTATLILSALACAVLADVAHVKAVKAKLVGHLAAKGKHHKRGILSHIPPYKLGHDIPLVTHSVVKPLLVTYPPTAAVATVKVPLSNPLLPHPVGVGHKVPGLPHPHYALRFPHTKYYVRPDHHFHHHHHHVDPKPVIPVPVAPPPPVVQAAPVVPTLSVAQATATIAHPLPIPLPPPQPAPLAPPPVHLFPHGNLHLRPVVSAAPLPVLPRPLIPLPQQFVIRPGSAVQTSYFATYPRYPLINSYQAPIYPLPGPVAALPAVQQVHQVLQPQSPHFHVLQQAVPHDVAVDLQRPNVLYDQAPTLVHQSPEVPQPAVHVHPTQETLPHPTFHIQPAPPSVPVEHDGWSPVAAQGHDTAPHDLLYPQQAHHFVQEQGTQVYEQHTDQQFHDFQHQIQQHVQQQIEQAQYEQQLQQQYGAPQLAPGYAEPDQYQGHDPVQQAQDSVHHAHDFVQQAHDYNGQVDDFAQQGHDISQFAQHGQQPSSADYGAAYPGREYGVPQPEGRSADDEQGPQFHNHIPLALQPPIDRPLDHFR